MDMSVCAKEAADITRTTPADNGMEGCRASIQPCCAVPTPYCERNCRVACHGISFRRRAVRCSSRNKKNSGSKKIISEYLLWWK